MSKFVAGNFRPEKSDLNRPEVNLLNQKAPNLSSQAEPYVCDLSTPDAQYERYHNLMRSNFYNLQANSTMQSGDYEQAQKYSHPSTHRDMGYAQIISEQKKQMLA